ncbi:hypothetical protein GCM10010448_34560 [Streptomyces glomeratus]|uniref:Uncharacterized protein n=1 Tax=Streptomyces glomeratus TaxID=284452 RepID=A0ABP6LL27_9ACTN
MLRETVHMACHPLHRRERHSSAVLVERVWNGAKTAQVRPDSVMVTTDVSLRKGGHRGTLPNISIRTQGLTACGIPHVRASQLNSF